MSQFTDNVVALNAVTTTTTSQPIDISMRQQVSFTLTTAGHTSGSGTLTVNVSNDGVNYIPAIAFQDATSVNSTTWVVSKVGNANGTVGGFLPMAPWRYLTYTVTVLTDGNYTLVHEAEG